MDHSTALAGLDQVDWSQLSHAYGSAEDVAGLLRDLASPAEETAAEAEEELWSSLVHQGTVYAATVPAVPFLARLAAEGVRRTAMVDMLGAIAGSADEQALPVPGAARAAVVAQFGLILPLLAADDRELRRTTAWAVAQCRSAAGPEAREALRARWSAERDPVVRADVLTACVLVDPAAAEELCAAALAGGGQAPVQVAALLATVDCGLPWTAEARTRLTALAPLQRHGFGGLWEREPLRALTNALHARGEVDAAIEVAEAALRRAAELLSEGSTDASAAVAEAQWAAESLALRSRTAPARLLPGLVLLLATGDRAKGADAADAVDVKAGADDADTARDVMRLLRTWGRSAPAAVPALLGIAQGGGSAADDALATLVCLGAPEASGLLARHLPDRPRALEAAYRLATGEVRTPVDPGSPGADRTPAGVRDPGADSTTLDRGSTAGDRTPLPCTPELLAAVRDRLSAEPPRERRSVFDGGLGATNEPIYLSGLLAAWGRSARPALPELLMALPRHPFPVSRALAVLADPRADAHVVAALRSQAEQGPLATRQTVAAALHTLTGHADALIAVLADLLTQRGNSLDHAVTTAATLGQAARPLLPHLRALLTSPGQPQPQPQATTTGVTQAALGAAALVWELTGDQHAVLPTIREGLACSTRAWGSATTRRAVEVAGRLGPAAAPLVPDLLPLLDHPELVPPVVSSLTVVHPEEEAPAGIARTDLADRVLAAARPGSYARSAGAVLEALLVLGPTAFTADRLDRIRELADGDRRVVGSGTQNRIILEDERFRLEARAVLRTLSA